MLAASDKGIVLSRHPSLKDFLNQAQMSTFNSHLSVKTLLSGEVDFSLKYVQ